MNGEPPTAVVTGAASGIGRATAIRLKNEGFDVLAVDRDDRGLSALPSGMRTLIADLADAADRDRVVAAGSGASALVNSAGVIRLKPILDVEVDDIRGIYAVNVEGLWDLTSRIGRTMNEGAIVNLSSSSAKLASTLEAAVYASSKAAVLSITRSFAYAFAPSGVRVNAICPGIIDTPMQDTVLAEVAASRHSTAADASAARTATVPLGRVATAVECAEAIWFLLSPAAGYMTGQAINFTGGLVMW
jgi:NAD(P)-dependent dehydrogenase (short-subunit alcohol dehydrogenase family)